MERSGLWPFCFLKKLLAYSVWQMYAKSSRAADIRQKMSGDLCFLVWPRSSTSRTKPCSKLVASATVLRGLITARSYQSHCQRTILLGPLTEPDSAQPLGPDGEILYDASRSIRAADVADQLSAVERKFGVRLVYGRRLLTQDGRRASPEVLLVDVSRPPERLNEFKRDLFLQFGLESHRYEQHWEYEQYLRLAEPGFAAVCALVGDAPFLLLAHEFMGLGTAFKALMSDAACKTLFYAHEVASVRPLVEERPGRDIAFYNALRQARVNGQYIDELFGPQDGYFKHALVSEAWRLDAVLAVGDWVVEELRFLGPEFAARPIDLVYNGVPAAELSLSRTGGGAEKGPSQRGRALRLDPGFGLHARRPPSREQGLVARFAGARTPRSPSVGAGANGRCLSRWRPRLAAATPRTSSAWPLMVGRWSTARGGATSAAAS